MQRVYRLIQESGFQPGFHAFHCALVGKQDEHGKLPAGIRKFHRAVSPAGHRAQGSLPVHHRHVNRRPIPQPEGARQGGFRFEGMLPRGVEIHRVGQHQPGERIQHALRDDVFYFLVGRLADPFVDLLPGGFGVLFIIHQAHAGGVVDGQGIQKILLEGEPGLTPQRVGHVQLEYLIRFQILHLGAALQLKRQFIERRVQAVPGQQKAERLRHLIGCLPLRAGIGHGQRDRDAVRRIEHVLIARGKLRIQRESEFVVSAHKLRQVGNRHRRSQVARLVGVDFLRLDRRGRAGRQQEKCGCQYRSQEISVFHGASFPLLCPLPWINDR